MTLFIHQESSPNYGPRRDGKKPAYLIFHYTGRTEAESHDRFMNPAPTNPHGPVSCHYMVHENGQITQYVHENNRAWHAGVGYWAGETDMNSVSIGIELVNLGVDADYPPFPEAQIAATIALARDILHRHPAITPFNVLGHSDIAPDRKVDPGPAFPWALLAENGVGVMPDDTTAYLMETDIGHSLTRIGYNPDLPLDVRRDAFCAHYAPEGLGEAGPAIADFKLWALAKKVTGVKAS